MTNVTILRKFFDERIRASNNKSLLRKLKSVSIARATGRISEEKAVFNVNKIMGYNSQPIFDVKKQKKFNPLAGVRTNQKKRKAVMEGLFEYNKKASKPQFPILGLKPVKSNSNRKRFVVAPSSKSWFDVRDFRKPVKQVSWKKQLAKHRVSESDKAMKQVLQTVNRKVNQKPVFNPNLGLPKFKKIIKKGKRQPSVAELMGFNR